ncbi:hypothetical protein [Streptomyces sp. NRRL S-118]|uniref:hypothetical protein n=1 Tax=Streptomyces sp. NRRL S-118 TaxID=1463881 RepID=UPI0004CA6EB7|nr:hypothetical protein [Streptomyces sp. NRRL S-118]
MTPRPLPSPPARLLRRLLLGVLCSLAGALLVTGGTLLLPDDVRRTMPEHTYGGLVLCTTLALCVAVLVRARRRRPRPPR